MSSPSDVRQPKYKVVRSRVYDDYVRPLLGDGGMIPSKQSLAEQYGVNVGTLDKALEELVSEGVIEKRRGAGTFVLPQADPALKIVGVYHHLAWSGDSRIHEFSHRLYETFVDELEGVGFACRHYVDPRSKEKGSVPMPQLVDDIGDGKVDVVVVVHSDWHYDDWLSSLTVPVIALGRDFGWGTVAFEPKASGAAAARLLMERGCRHVELLSVLEREWEATKDTVHFMRPLRAGINNALLAEGLPSPETWLTQEHYPESIRDMPGSFDDERKGYELCKALFRLAKPDGIVVFTDVMALGVARALDEMGLTLGRDIHGVVLGAFEVNFPGLERFLRLDISIADIAARLVDLAQSALVNDAPRTLYVRRRLNEGQTEE